MDSELDKYLVSEDALKQSAHLDETSVKSGDNIDGFLAISFLGRGTSCEVWRVYDGANKCDVALKLFALRERDNPSPELSERFLAEARLLASIHHPNIIRTHQSGTYRGKPYFTMDLLRPLPVHMRERQIIALGLDMCRALGHLHSLSVIHRDIKPDNILVAPDGHYVLADLGIVRIDDSSLSRFAHGATGNENPTVVGGKSHALGTPGYAAPEQLAGNVPTPATDIHALGVLFDIMFDRQPPFFWRLLIRRMTSSIPSFRYSTIKSVKRGLLVCKHLWIGYLGIFLALLTCIGGLHAVSRKPKWATLPPESVKLEASSVNGRKFNILHITLPSNGSYTRGDLIRPLNSWFDWDKKTEVFRRSKVIIEGPGRFYAPQIAGAEVHLVSNVTLFTSSESPTNKYFRSFYVSPIPVDDDGTIMILPKFTIDKGSRLIREP